MGADNSKFAILACQPPDALEACGCEPFEDMFLRLLRDEGRDESWRCFAAWRGELPSNAELGEFAGVVVTGSVADAFADEPWLAELRRVVRAAMDGSVRVLGVCFGHQLVATVLGAPVGRAGCWEVGARRVEVQRGARAAILEADGGAWARLLPDTLCLHEFHRDQVLAVPPGATLLASSERCPLEAFAVGPRVLCIQGHPEFDAATVERLAKPRLGSFEAEDAARMRSSLAELPVAADAPTLQALCRAFLKGEGPPAL